MIHTRVGKQRYGASPQQPSSSGWATGASARTGGTPRHVQPRIAGMGTSVRLSSNAVDMLVFELGCQSDRTRRARPSSRGHVPTKCPNCAGFGHLVKPVSGSRRNWLIINLLPIPLDHSGPFRKVSCPACNGFGFVDKAQANVMRATSSATMREALLCALLILLGILGLFPGALFVMLITQDMYLLESYGFLGFYATLTILVAVAYRRARRRSRLNM
jgi:hypothetical protein